MLGITETTVDVWLLSCLLAFSAYVVLTGGTFSFAYVAFIAVGAYTAGIVATDFGLSIWVSLIVAPVIAGIVGALLAKPLARLSGIYLAIASVSFVGLVQILLVNLDEVTGGVTGIIGLPLVLETWHLALAVGVLAVALRQVQRSSSGRAIRMMRIDPLVAGAMGVNVPRLGLILFSASAAVAAVAGVLRGHYFGFVTPNEYGFDLIILLLAMVIIGGVGSWTGPLIGAAIFTLLPEWLQGFGEWRDVITGALLLVIVILSREGIAGAVNLAWYRWRRRGAGAEAEPLSPATPAEPPATSAVVGQPEQEEKS